MSTDPRDELRSGQTLDPATPPGARKFPCRNCGGPLLFKPGTTHLKCPYCGTENDIPVDAGDGEHLRENDLLQALEEEEKRRGDDSELPVMSAIRCDNCGADTTMSADRTSERCPYCGSPLSIQNRHVFKLNVQALLPFVVDADKALSVYREWIASRWFAPGDFKRRATREEAMNGIYMPYWTYDADTVTEYAGRRGDAYYTTETHQVTVNGKPEMRTRQVRHIRWTPVSGTVSRFFDDVLVPASQSLPRELQDKLEPWELKNLLPFRQEFLSGFVTESYRVGLRDGFADAKRLMDGQIYRDVCRDIGGDEQDVRSRQTSYGKTTYKHILLPLWLSAYAYGGRTYRFMINAQTGEAAGDRPWSIFKIALAVAAGLAVAGLAWWLMGDGSGFQDMLNGAY